MSDETLRELERAWRESGDAQDEAAYLREALRAGRLSSLQVQTAAYLGHPAALAALDGASPPLPGAEHDESLASRWGEGFRRLALEFDPAPEAGGEEGKAPGGGDAFFADLEDRLGGRSLELDELLADARRTLARGETPPTGTLTRILYLATSKPTVEALGDEVPAIAERLLGFASYEAEVAPSPWQLGPQAKALVERFGLAILRRVFGFADSSLIFSARMLSFELERGVASSTDWSEKLDELALLHLIGADGTLRGSPPAWERALAEVREDLGYGCDERDPVYGCASVLLDPESVAEHASQVLPLEQLRLAACYALAPLLLDYGTDPLIDEPLPWDQSVDALPFTELEEGYVEPPTFPTASQSPDELRARRLELAGDPGKFWQVSYGDGLLQVRSGKIGAKGRSKRETFLSPVATLRRVEESIGKKLRKGFVEVDPVTE